MPHGKTHNKGDLNKDGKMSSYETRRSNAIKNAMAKSKRKSHFLNLVLKNLVTLKLIYQSNYLYY